jgi:hypothetical protein
MKTGPAGLTRPTEPAERWLWLDLSRIDTTPSAEGPFAPPIGMDDGKAYARHQRQICDGLLRQDFGVVARWVCTPRPHAPTVIVTGPFSDVFTTCLKRFFAALRG